MSAPRGASPCRPAVLASRTNGRSSTEALDGTGPAQLRPGRLAHRHRRGAATARRRDRRGDRQGLLGGRRLRRGAGSRPRRRRARAAGADVPPARGAAQGPGGASARAPRRAVRGVGAHRRHPRRLQVRRRRRHRHAARLRVEGQAGAAQRHRLRRRRGGAAQQGRDLRRPAHLHVAARGRGAGQRVQLPGVGAAGEARPRVPRRRAERGQAREPHGVPHGQAGGADRRIGVAPRGHAAARRRERGRHVRPPHRAGPRLVHRLGGHRRQAAHQPDDRGAGRPVQRRGRLAQPLDPRPRRHCPARRSSTSTSRVSSPR